MSKVLTDFEWFRGDTYEFTITIKSNGVPVNLTGFTNISFCVNTDKNPANTDNEIINTIGVLDADPTTGKIAFSFDAVEADFVGKAYYDIQGLDAAGKRRTFAKGYKAEFIQDINKD